MAGLPRAFVITSALAGVGAILLVVIMTTYWLTAGDSLAYWIAASRLQAGLPIYTSPETAFADFAYHYPPPLAQALAPFTVVVSAVAYSAIYRVAVLLALWELMGRNFLRLLASIAFIPIAVAVRIENVELFMALAVALGLGRWPWLFSASALVKASPGLGLVYLAMRRRWRDLAIALAVGGGITIVSFLLAPTLWPAWIEAIAGRAEMVGNSLVPVPYAVRALAGLCLAVVAGFIGRRTGELILVCAVTIANPGLSLQGFAVLAAMVPIWRAGPDGLGTVRERTRAGLPAAVVGTRADDAVVGAS